MSHNLEREYGANICSSCGAALHPDGYWWLAGYKSKIEPACTPYRVDKSWAASAEYVFNDEDGICKQTCATGEGCSCKGA